MSSFLTYLGSLQDFTQRNPIVVGSTVSLVVIVGVLFSLLPSRQVEDRAPLPREMSTTHNAKIKVTGSSEVGVGSATSIATDRTAVRQQGSAMEQPQRPEPLAARPGRPDGRPPISQKAPGGGFTVQVGSFGSEKAAERLTAQLKASGYRAFVKPAEIRGKGRTYRVRVGMFTTRDDAKRYGDRLVAREKIVKSVFTTIND